MIAFKKILWPTDFSEPSYFALQTAIELARRFGSELVVLNVIPVVPVMAAPTGTVAIDIPLLQREMEESASRNLDSILEERIPKEVKAVPKASHGDAADEIVKAADEENADLIVMATHGRTGWRHLIFGSVAEKVIRMAEQPVLIIRAPKK